MGEVYTDFLTASGSTLVGAASAFAISGEFFHFNKARSAEESDAIALHQDFVLVGRDIFLTKEQFEQENREKLCA